MTNAERQRNYRRRHAQRVAELQQAPAALRAEVAEVRRQLATARQDLADALAENERLAKPACHHPAEAVLDGRCHACGADVW
jgi:hypothetical protein